MQTFKKILISVLLFVFIFVGFSFAFIEPFINSEYCYYQDKYMREELAGQIDYIVIGSSYAVCGFDPAIIDDRLDVCSYNLSNALMPLHAEYEMLKKEIERNDISTCVFAISYSTLNRDSENENGEGDVITYSRLDTLGDRMSYLVNNVDFNDWDNIYSSLFISSIQYYRSKYTDGYINNINHSLKNYYPRDNTDVTLSREEIDTLYNTESYDDFTQIDIDYMTQMISLCKDKGIKVYLALIPVSDAKIWKTDNLDKTVDDYFSFAKDNEVCLIDFNLLKDRYTLFSDSVSFYDNMHMSKEGTNTFTNVFCDIISMIESGQEIDDLFYDSYEELKNDSPYNNK